MSTMPSAPFPNQFGDIITAKRTQYVQKNETKQIINGIVELTEVPDSFTKVQVTGNNMDWYETKGSPSGNLYQVDYGNPLVYFDPQYNNVSLNFNYMGTGNKLISSNQIYTALDSNGNVTQTLSDLTTNANTATTQAQQATTDANNATSQLTTLENTVNTNEQTRQTNEQSRVTAEQNRVTAESNRVTAESDRQNNESTRQTDETSRQNAESSRVAAESSRVSAEQYRVNAEITRQNDESTRQTNEANRVNAENDRVTAENTRVSQESTRQTNETNRENAESTRESNEATRQSNESSRVSAENTRVSQESDRVTAENTRNSNESTRQSQESTRQSNETSRENAEQTRETNEDARQSNESTRESNETTRQTAINNLVAQSATWSNATAYKARNIVRYGSATYVALQDNTGFEPDQNVGTYWQVVAEDGSITSVTSANTDISVANGTVAPVLTANSGNGANQLWKLDGNANAILNGNLGLGASSPNYGIHLFGGGARIQMLTNSPTPTITNIGTTGTTSYTYYIVAKDRNGNRSWLSNLGSTGNGNATLDTNNYNMISWNAINGAVSYDVLVFVSSNYYLLGNTTNTSFNDTGIARSTIYTIPVYNETSDFTLDGNVNLMPQKPATGSVGSNSHKSSSRLNFNWSSWSGSAAVNKAAYMYVDNDTFYWYNSTGTQLMVLSSTALSGIKSFSTQKNTLDDGNGTASVSADFKFWNTNSVSGAYNSGRLSFGAYDGVNYWYNWLKTDQNGTLGFYKASSNEWNNNTGSLVFSVDGSGNVNANGIISSNGVPVQLNQMVTTLPTASVSYRGQTIVLQGNGTSTADVAYICLMSSTGTYSWKQVVSG